MNNAVNAVDARVKDIAVQRETVRGTFRVGGNCAAKAVQIDKFVGVVELKDVADGLEDLQILVSLGIEVVE